MNTLLKYLSVHFLKYLSYNLLVSSHACQKYNNVIKKRKFDLLTLSLNFFKVYVLCLYSQPHAIIRHTIRSTNRNARAERTASEINCMCLVYIYNWWFWRVELGVLVEFFGIIKSH